MSKKMYLLNRVGRCFPKKTRILLYKALVGTHIDYCAPLLFGLNQNEIEELQKIQNIGMRFITGRDRYTSINVLLKESSLVPVKRRILARTLVFIHKIKLGIAPAYLAERLMKVGNVHNYSTRACADETFFIEHAVSTRMKKSVFGDGVIIYNSLPNRVKNLSLGQFKANCLIFV